MISLYRRLEWLLKGFDSSCQSLSVKNTLKNKQIDFSGLNTFRHFFNTNKLTDLAQTKPSKFKKKGCEKPSFLLMSCITKKAKDLAGVNARKEVIKGPRDNPKTNTLIFLL